MLKKILPFEKLTYCSDLQSQQLLTRLRNTILNKEYSGRIYQNKFEIKRKINYRNSFLPIIKGEITDGFNGSRIQVKMELIGFVTVFMAVWMGIVFLILAATLYDVAVNNERVSNPSGVLIPLGMSIFGTLMVILGFKYESRTSIRDLEKIFNAKLIIE